MRVLDVVYVPFISYVKDVLPNEWLPNRQTAAYQAGAMAVRDYGWYFVNNWRGLRVVDFPYQLYDDKRPPSRAPGSAPAA